MSRLSVCSGLILVDIYKQLLGTSYILFFYNLLIIFLTQQQQNVIKIMGKLSRSMEINALGTMSLFFSCSNLNNCLKIRRVEFWFCKSKVINCLLNQSLMKMYLNTSSSFAYWARHLRTFQFLLSNLAKTLKFIFLQHTYSTTISSTLKHWNQESSPSFKASSACALPCLRHIPSLSLLPSLPHRHSEP